MTFHLRETSLSGRGLWHKEWYCHHLGLTLILHECEDKKWHISPWLQQPVPADASPVLGPAFADATARAVLPEFLPAFYWPVGPPSIQPGKSKPAVVPKKETPLAAPRRAA